MTANHFSHGTRRSSGECAGKTLKKAYVTAGSGTVSSAQNASVGPRRNSGTMNSKFAMGASPMKPPSISARSHACGSSGRCSRTTAATIRNGSG